MMREWRWEGANGTEALERDAAKLGVCARHALGSRRGSGRPNPNPNPSPIPTPTPSPSPSPNPDQVMDDPSEELSDEVSVLVPADKLPSDRLGLGLGLGLGLRLG